MSDTKISCRDNGPFIVEGSFAVLDAEGNPFPAASGKPVVALCRCGHSAKRPFCDGTHTSVKFESSERADG